MIFAFTGVLIGSGLIFGFSSNQNNCPLEGTPECPKINCPLAGTPDCPYNLNADEIPDCCKK